MTTIYWMIGLLVTIIGSRSPTLSKFTNGRILSSGWRVEPWKISTSPLGEHLPKPFWMIQIFATYVNGVLKSPLNRDEPSPTLGIPIDHHNFHRAVIATACLCQINRVSYSKSWKLGTSTDNSSHNLRVRLWQSSQQPSKKMANILDDIGRTSEPIWHLEIFSSQFKLERIRTSDFYDWLIYWQVKQFETGWTGELFDQCIDAMSWKMLNLTGFAHWCSFPNLLWRPRSVLKWHDSWAMAEVSEWLEFSGWIGGHSHS